MAQSRVERESLQYQMRQRNKEWNVARIISFPASEVKRADLLCNQSLDTWSHRQSGRYTILRKGSNKRSKRFKSIRRGKKADDETTNGKKKHNPNPESNGISAMDRFPGMKNEMQAFENPESQNPSPLEPRRLSYRRLIIQNIQLSTFQRFQTQREKDHPPGHQDDEWFYTEGTGTREELTFSRNLDEISNIRKKAEVHSKKGEISSSKNAMYYGRRELRGSISNGFRGSAVFGGFRLHSH
ncbi:hypothetical protein B0H11DRAFT_1904971 [Mycena galericulata]|nr:hypothetical protein B0H11DRAFT_1904971 [Mycena galericulata]